MNKDENMKNYKDELQKKTSNYMSIMEEWGTTVFYEKHIVEREKLHYLAMECINKILPLELKIFVKNLCANTLGYPDEPIFYKAFGDNPKAGDRISKTELEQKGIDIKEFDEMIEIWGLEGTFVEKQTIDGEDFYYLDSLCERADITSEEELERLNASVELKYSIRQKTNMSMDEQDKYIQYVNDLLLGITPQRKAEIKLHKFAKELVENPVFSNLSKDAQDFFKKSLK
ncbi:MAG: hypothetical protein IJP61_01195 [Treponema sp.]|nr:hypothetical protein [Treponema sp.]